MSLCGWFCLFVLRTLNMSSALLPRTRCLISNCRCYVAGQLSVHCDTVLVKPRPSPPRGPPFVLSMPTPLTLLDPHRKGVWACTYLRRGQAVTHSEGRGPVTSVSLPSCPASPCLGSHTGNSVHFSERAGREPCPQVSSE